MSNLKVTKCDGEGQGSCKMCEDNGKWNRAWMCFLYKIEGYEGCYCLDCVEKIRRRRSMGDLISRKELFNKLFVKDGRVCPDTDIDNFPIMLNARYLKQEIRNSPIAYDVEKVIRQLEENKEDAIKTTRKVCNSHFAPEQADNLVELLEVYTREQIEIVKKGGV